MQVPKIDHEWYVLVIVAAGLAKVALTVVADLIDGAKTVYIKIRDFNERHNNPKASP